MRDPVHSTQMELAGEDILRGIANLDKAVARSVNDQEHEDIVRLRDHAVSVYRDRFTRPPGALSPTAESVAILLAENGMRTEVAMLRHIESADTRRQIRERARVIRESQLACDVVPGPTNARRDLEARR